MTPDLDMSITLKIRNDLSDRNITSLVSASYINGEALPYGKQIEFSVNSNEITKVQLSDVAVSYLMQKNKDSAFVVIQEVVNN